MEDIKLKIFNEYKTFLGKNNSKPQKLLIPPDLENELLLFNPYPDISKSPRDAFKKIWGMDIVWDASTLEVR